MIVHIGQFQTNAEQQQKEIRAFSTLTTTSALAARVVEPIVVQAPPLCAKLGRGSGVGQRDVSFYTSTAGSNDVCSVNTVRTLSKQLTVLAHDQVVAFVFSSTTVQYTAADFCQRAFIYHDNFCTAIVHRNVCHRFDF